MNKITPKQLKEKLHKGNVAILDVRSKEKFKMGHLKHSHAENIHIPKTEIFSLEETDTEAKLPFSPNQEVIVTCTTGNSATRCTKILTDKGYNVTLLEGGMTAWHQEQETFE